MSLDAQQWPRSILRVAAAALTLTSFGFGPARADSCHKLMAVRDPVDLFDDAAADTAALSIAKRELPHDLCGVPTGNGRYRIIWNGRDQWVLGSQFSAGPARLEPFPSQRQHGTAGVRLGAAQLPPTGIGAYGVVVAWEVILEGDATVTITISERFGKAKVNYDPAANFTSGGKA